MEAETRSIRRCVQGRVAHPTTSRYTEVSATATPIRVDLPPEVDHSVPAPAILPTMTRRPYACFVVWIAFTAISCAPHSPPATETAGDPPPMGAGGGSPTEPSSHTYIAPPGEIDEEAYRAGRPAALMDFLFRHRQPEIPPPGAPIVELDLTELMLDYEVLAAIGTLPDLEVLLLGGTNVDDKGIPPLCELPRLTLLGLRRTLVTDKAIPHLARLPNLQRIYLSDTSVSDAGMAHLATMDRLLQLALANTRVTGSGVSRLERLASLERLWLDSTKLGDDGVEMIARSFPRLEILFIGQTEVTDAGVAEIARLSNLAVLSLENTPVTDASVPILAGLGSLRRVNLRGTAVTPVGIETLSTQRPELRVFTGDASLGPAPATEKEKEDRQNVDTSGQLN